MISDITAENYEEKRRELLEVNSNLNSLVLRESEKKLDSYLSSLKNEYRESCGRKIRYDIPVLTDPALRASRLYRFCSKLPKGADLHVHDMALLPACELIPLLADTPEFCINADRASYDLKYVPCDSPVPDGYIRFAEALDSGLYSEDELIVNWTVSGAGGEDIWDYFEKLFTRHSALSESCDFAEKYYDRAFRYYCGNNVMHIEIHMMLTDSMEESEEYVRAVRNSYYRVKKEFPFLTVRIIGAGVKADNAKKELSKKCFLNASYVQEMIKDESVPGRAPNLIIGFDLVNEEDRSLPLHDFAPMLLGIRKQYPDMKLYIHGGESLDAENENLIDAYLLGVSRVGHGLNLYRYPDLHSKFIESEICLEVCPISNQTLQYTTDIRNHPATEYLRTGLPIALCSDDPSYMENETLTDDFFAAVVGWNLSLGDLKQLGINSIMYSGLDHEEKAASMRAYNLMWKSFVERELRELGI